MIISFCCTVDDDDDNNNTNTMRLVSYNSGLVIYIWCWERFYLAEIQCTLFNITTTNTATINIYSHQRREEQRNANNLTYLS